MIKLPAILAVLLGILCGWFAFMWADTTPPYEYDAVNSVIIPETVSESTQQVTVKWKLKRVNRMCPGSTVRELFDPTTGVVLAVYDAVPTAGVSNIEHGYLIRTFLLPWAVLPPGRIGYRATIRYQCNFLQRFNPLVVTTPNLYFYVKKRDMANDR